MKNAIKLNGEGSEISALQEQTWLQGKHHQSPAQSVLKYEEQWNKRGLVSVSGAARVHR